MTTPKKMDADALSSLLFHLGDTHPVASLAIEAHVAALEQEAAAAEARGFERAKEQAAKLIQGGHNPPCYERPMPTGTTVGECGNCARARIIRAMQDGQRGGEEETPAFCRRPNCGHAWHKGACPSDVCACVSAWPPINPNESSGD